MNIKMKAKLLFVILSFFFLNCEKSDVAALGVIQGKVTVGPLCGTVPAGLDPNRDNPCGLSDADLNAIYGDYKVVVSPTISSDKVTAQEKVLDKSGAFVFEIPTGEYKVQVLKKDGSAIVAASEKNILTKTINLSQNQVVEVSLYVEKTIK
jgi:hypothetical protein